jgi:hypothetical protein
VSGWLPTASNEVDIEATPEASGAAPSCEAPSIKVTVPSGVPDEADTVAVNVTVSPYDDASLGEFEVSVVVEAIAPMVKVPGT